MLRRGPRLTFRELKPRPAPEPTISAYLPRLIGEKAIAGALDLSLSAYARAMRIPGALPVSRCDRGKAWTTQADVELHQARDASAVAMLCPGVADMIRILLGTSADETLVVALAVEHAANQAAQAALDGASVSPARASFALARPRPAPSALRVIEQAPAIARFLEESVRTTARRITDDPLFPAFATPGGLRWSTVDDLITWRLRSGRPDGAIATLTVRGAGLAAGRSDAIEHAASEGARDALAAASRGVMIAT